MKKHNTQYTPVQLQNNYTKNILITIGNLPKKKPLIQQYKIFIHWEKTLNFQYHQISRIIQVSLKQQQKYANTFHQNGKTYLTNTSNEQRQKSHKFQTQQRNNKLHL